MRIAQICPLYESVPPRLYGGTERVVSYLTEELVAQGHEVTLFASGDSRTAARLEAVVAEAYRLNPAVGEPHAHHVRLLGRLAAQAADFDVIHSHLDYLPFPLLRQLKVPHLTTLHGRLDLPELKPLYSEYADMPLVSISHAQRRPLPDANWARTVHHGLPPDLYEFHPEPGEYLAFIGRISPEKRLDRAIRVAQATGIPLRVAAKVDRADRDYFEAVIAPLLKDPLIEFEGEIGEQEKSAFLGRARALICPIEWPEPFGLVVIEAFACGTPVIAWPRGALPEVLRHGRTGFLVDSEQAAAEAVERIPLLDRARCREEARRRFSVSRMAEDYLEAYARVMGQGDSVSIAS